MKGVIPRSRSTYNIEPKKSANLRATLVQEMLVLCEFLELSEPRVHFSNAIDRTNTQGVRMAGVWGRKGAYGAHISMIVRLVGSRNNPLHIVNVNYYSRCQIRRH